MPEHYLFAQSLYGQRSEGNWHTLVYSEQAVPPERLASELRELPNLIQFGGTPDALWARFYQKGQPILRCGSANIAIAESARQLFGVPAQGGWPLNTRAGIVWVGCDDHGPYYHDRPLSQRPIPAPDRWQRLLSVQCVNGCYAGCSTDYCLLLLPTPVEQVQPDLQGLCDLSQRALILLYYPCYSAPSGYARPAADQAQLRYFAPQYGVAEDAATGSASVQAAHFFWQRYGQAHMTFAQHSKEGGHIQTETRGDGVLVRGNARISEAIRGFSTATLKAGGGRQR